MTPANALQIAIDGGTYEYTEMYPGQGGMQGRRQDRGRCGGRGCGPVRGIISEANYECYSISSYLCISHAGYRPI